MSLFWIVGFALAVLAILAWTIYRMPEEARKKKKARREPPPEPVKDWEAIVARLEKKVASLNQLLQSAQLAVKDQEAEVQEKDSEINTLKRQYEQEKLWREKEEAHAQKEKKREDAMKEELRKTQEALDRESTLRIRLEYDIKELKNYKEQSTIELRRFSSLNTEAEKKIGSLGQENQELRAANIELKKKKEDTQWIARSDYKALEAQFRSIERELDLLKKQQAAGAASLAKSSATAQEKKEMRNCNGI